MGKQLLTDEQKEFYISSGGIKCPYCGTENIEGGHRETNDGIMTQSVYCHNCRQEWDDVYKLISVQEW